MASCPGCGGAASGAALLDAVMAEAGRRRLGSVVLEVAADNEAARRLYGATGFIRVGSGRATIAGTMAAIDALILRRADRKRARAIGCNP